MAELSSGEVVYRKPPLKEAACEFRFIAGERWDPTIPGLFWANTKELFPRKGTSRSFRVAGGDAPKIELNQLVRLLSEDEKQFVQLAPNFLSVHRLEPYTGWTAFRPLIERALTEYLSLSAPSAVQRVGLRYINTVTMQVDRLAVADYLHFFPELGPNLPNTTTAFGASATFPFEHDRDQLKLQLRSFQSGVDSQSFSLDLDYSLSDSEGLALDQLTAWLATAHSHVLQVFRDCLTPKLENLFEPLQS